MDKYEIILNAEQQFAREVTLGVIVTSPQTFWHYIIPGFFVIDFLRRTSAIRQFTQYFMFPRKHALQVARAMSEGEEKSSIIPRLEGDLRQWLDALKLFSPELVGMHLNLIDVLAEHYTKLLRAEGKEFNFLIENAYQNHHSFSEFIEQITAAEKAVDEKVIEALGEDEKAKAKILAEQQQIEKRRQKMLEDIF